jgi:cyclopropane-fatty-acyl-phospholipid synthase
MQSLQHPYNAVKKNGEKISFQTAKKFHVSPFFRRQGYYKFILTEPVQQIDNQIHFHEEEDLALIARIHGHARPMNNANLLKTVIKYPITASLTMPRILWQAAKLYWQKKLPVYTRPVPNDQRTIRYVPATVLDRIGHVFIKKHLSQLKNGSLCMLCPDGEQQCFGATTAEPQKLTVKEQGFFRKVLLSGEIGFGEAYTNGDWTTDNLPGLLSALAANDELVDDRRLSTAALGRWFNTMCHWLRANTIKGSSRNIREHYDLSNDFFATFLDPSMTYSAAIFKHESDSLAVAQNNKIQQIIAKAEIKASDHVLEIGCGWGSFALEVVRQTGCRLTGITLSHEQLDLALQRVKEAGLEDRIDLKICDYRHIKGTFDKVISIEMLEAVGHAGLKPFFKACDNALVPGGKAVIQVITIPDRKYTAYRYSSDWIRKYIFPGGHLPSIGALGNAMAVSSLNINSLECYGLDYARTLDLWRQTLLEKRQQIFALGYDEYFLRKWEYYFAYCQAGFSTRIIDLAQFVLEKPKHS